MASSGNSGDMVVIKCDQIVRSSEKPYFLMLGTGHDRYKTFDYILHAYQPHLWLTTCFLLMRTTTTQVSRYVNVRGLCDTIAGKVRAGYVLYRALVFVEAFW